MDHLYYNLIPSAFIKVAKQGVAYDYSSVQFDFPKALADKVLKWGKDNIADSDLYKEGDKYGRENEIHVTIKYGLHTASEKEVKELVSGFGEFEIRLGEISRFVPPDKDYDVVKIGIDGDYRGRNPFPSKLHELHKLIGDNLENSDEHPVYRPHCTIAYVKKGHCADLSGSEDLGGATAKVSKLTFSSKNGKKFSIDLGE